jgi:TM2 domain-containing membrane protein YozV
VILIFVHKKSKKGGLKLKSKKIAVLLSIFGGTFGLHKFYLHKYWQGFIYSFFWFTGVPTILGFIGAFRVSGRVEEFNKTNQEKLNIKKVILMLIGAPLISSLIFNFAVLTWAIYSGIYSEIFYTKDEQRIQWNTEVIQDGLNEEKTGSGDVVYGFLQSARKKDGSKMSQYMTEELKNRISEKEMDKITMLIGGIQNFQTDSSVQIGEKWMITRIKESGFGTEKKKFITFFLVKTDQIKIDGIATNQISIPTKSDEIVGYKELYKDLLD